MYKPSGLYMVMVAYLQSWLFSFAKEHRKTAYHIGNSISYGEGSLRSIGKFSIFFSIILTNMEIHIMIYKSYYK